MRMTFAEWIREQKDICDKLKEQNYEDLVCSLLGRQLKK